MFLLPIKKSAEFKEINLKGSKFYSGTTILLTRPTSSFYFQDPIKNKKAKDFCRIGYTVSKVVGNAVNRNLAKRRLRVAFKQLFLQYAKNHYDYVVIARKEIAKADLAKILNDVKFCLKRIHENRSQTK